MIEKVLLTFTITHTNYLTINGRFLPKVTIKIIIIIALYYASNFVMANTNGQYIFFLFGISSPCWWPYYSKHGPIMRGSKRQIDKRLTPELALDVLVLI